MANRSEHVAGPANAEDVRKALATVDRISTARLKSLELHTAEDPALPPSNDYPFYAYRMWHGMTASAWFRLLARNHFAVSPTRARRALAVSACSIINSVLNLTQQLLFSKRIAAFKINAPPIFIIGHWRTGTTYLHELLVLDERFIAPSTLECFAPGHFLVSGWLLRKLAFLLPATRPMDNMLFGWDHPQEDEFALLNLGLGSPYENMAFPNRGPVHLEHLNMTEVSSAQIEAWKAGLSSFLQRVIFRSNREKRLPDGAIRIVLKSPAHTARVQILRQLFPAARFIHLVRNPFDIFASTVRFWRAMYDTQGFQKPRYGQLPNGRPSVEEYVLYTMDLLYRDFSAQISEIPPQSICNVRYEDLVRAPVAEMNRIYNHLSLGSFEPMPQKIETHLLKLADYKPNTHLISEEQKSRVRQRWRWYFERYDYLM